MGSEAHTSEQRIGISARVAAGQAAAISRKQVAVTQGARVDDPSKSPNLGSPTSRICNWVI